MQQLRLSCLGDIEIHWGPTPVSRFESQKSRALLVYLILQRGRALSRDTLAGLLWPESPNDSARRNLRQALYSLKNGFEAANRSESEPLIVVTDRHDIRFNPKIDVKVDKESFEEAIDDSEGQPVGNPQRLMEAISLYRGDFLAGLQLKDAEDFEIWMIAEQERLRERMMEALRELIRSYLERGAYRLGIPFAQRLVALDPMSDVAHRSLIELYALSGRRGSALDHYEEFSRLLDDELGVEPAADTVRLRDQIVAQQNLERSHGPAPSDALGPVVPLVGRQEQIVRLREAFRHALDGTLTVTLVRGEPGVGKSRLMKSFLASGTPGINPVVVKGRCFDEVPVRLQPFTQLIDTILTSTDIALVTAREACRDLLQTLVQVSPAAHLAVADQKARRRARTAPLDAVEAFLVRVGESLPSGSLLVLLLDDLEYADSAALELLARLDRSLRKLPVWILAGYSHTGLDTGHPLETLADGACGSPAHQLIELSPLKQPAFDEISSSLLSGSQVSTLSRYLRKHSSGLPLEIAEWVNYLWDEGILAADRGRWRLTADPPARTPRIGDVGTLISRRIKRLPSSTRRTATLAALAGSTFEAEILSSAGYETPAVVNLALENLIERWMIRRFHPEWQQRERQRDLTMWSLGARRGSFEFGSKLTRRLLAFAIHPERRRVLHADLAKAIETLHAGGLNQHTESLAHHHELAHQYGLAWPYLKQAGDHARRAGARETSHHYYGRALKCLKHHSKESKKPFAREFASLRALVKKSG